MQLLDSSHGGTAGTEGFENLLQIILVTVTSSMRRVGLQACQAKEFSEKLARY